MSFERLSHVSNAVIYNTNCIVDTTQAMALLFSHTPTSSLHRDELICQALPHILYTHRGVWHPPMQLSSIYCKQVYAKSLRDHVTRHTNVISFMHCKQ